MSVHAIPNEDMLTQSILLREGSADNGSCMRGYITRWLRLVYVENFGVLFNNDSFYPSIARLWIRSIYLANHLCMI